MGAFPMDEKKTRDNNTIFENADHFGQEWQVLPTEPKLFHDVEGPQAPEACAIPSVSDMRCRLADSIITLEAAEIACSRVSEEERGFCMFDVMSTNDVWAAGAY